MVVDSVDSIDNVDSIYNVDQVEKGSGLRRPVEFYYTIGHKKRRQRRPPLFSQLRLTILLFFTWSTSTTTFFNLVDVVNVVDTVDFHFTAFFITPKKDTKMSQGVFLPLGANPFSSRQANTAQLFGKQKDSKYQNANFLYLVILKSKERFQSTFASKKNKNLYLYWAYLEVFASLDKIVAERFQEVFFPPSFQKAVASLF